MAPSITTLGRRLGPARSLGTCLVCRDAIRDDGRAVRFPRGGYVHRGCATYRIRRR